MNDRANNELFLQRDSQGRVIPPNIRKVFIFDPGYLGFEADLKGADAQVVAWEAEDDDLKGAFRSGVDIHAKNAEDMFGTKFTQLAGHARDRLRKGCKATVHGINYGCTPRTTAIQQGWTVYEAERFHHRWLNLHPGIRARFHDGHRVALSTNRTIFNKFGFRRVFFDRIENCFTEALAWTPQSTVAINTYIGAIQLESKFPRVEFLLQGHDSLVFQFPLTECPSLSEIQETLSVVTPYDDPLRIPWEIKIGTRSWGDMEKSKESALYSEYPALFS